MSKLEEQLQKSVDAMDAIAHLKRGTGKMRVTASRELAPFCLHWSTLELPYDVSGPAALTGTAFHDLAATGQIVAKVPDESAADARSRWESWKRNGAKLIPPGARFEVAFSIRYDGRIRELGQGINRRYGLLEDGEIPGTVDWFGSSRCGDWKTGKKRVDADSSFQLHFARAVTNSPTGEFHYISKDGRTTVDKADIDPKRSLKVVADIALRLRDGDTEPTVGGHCDEHWCPARERCAAYTRAFGAYRSRQQSNITTQPVQEKPMKMSLANVRKGRIETPFCVVLYGPEGIGKSTFAANAPAPIFLGAEDGTAHLDVDRFAVPATWAETLEALNELSGEHSYQTAVIDTADWIEPIIHAHVCEEGGKESIEDFGYGKGYTAALDIWRDMLDKLDALRTAKRMNIIILAHSQVKTFRNPAGDDYDRYELKLHGKAAGLIKEWANAVLFTNYKTYTREKDGRVRAVGDGSRVVYTEHRPAWDAKNRYDLPFELPLNWEEFAAAARAGQPASAEKLLAEIETLMASVDETTKKKATAALARAAGDSRKLAQLSDFLKTKISESEAA